MQVKYLKQTESHGARYNYEGIEIFFRNEGEIFFHMHKISTKSVSDMEFWAKHNLICDFTEFVAKKFQAGFVTNDGPTVYISKELPKEKRFALLLEVIEFIEEKFQTTFPKEMLVDMAKHYNVELCKASDLKKLIEDNKGDEALQIAKKVPSESLCFQLGEFALEKGAIALAKKFYQAVPEYAKNHLDAAATRIIEINMQSKDANDIKIKQETFAMQYGKALITKESEDGVNARRLLADLAGMPMTAQAPFSAYLNATTIMCELAYSHKALVVQNQSLLRQIEDLQKQLAASQNQANGHKL